MKRIVLVLAILGAVTQVAAQSLRLKSNVEVSYGQRGSINARDTSKVEGKIKGVYWSDNFNTVAVDYSYTDTVGNVIMTNAYKVTGAEIQAIYETIKDEIPEGLTRSEREEYEMYLGFRYIMSQTFGISQDDISIYVEN